MKRASTWLGAVILVSTLPGCGTDDGNVAPETSGDVLTSALAADADATQRPLEVSCENLLAALHYPNTVFTSATSVAAGGLVQPGQTLPAHCLLTGRMFERTSAIDGQTYAIGFEMRLPTSWSGRFFYQANGGLDGIVAPAVGNTSGGGPLTSALLQGFAVLSSDAGHNALQNPTFGVDPQARLDFGYQAVGKLTPMAKSVIKTTYGKKAKYSYIGGCSNGGRHSMVAAARYADEYDGYLVGSPGFNLPSAAVASIYGAQQYAPLSGGAVIPGGPFAGLPDLSAAFTPPEQQLLVAKVLERCDALDGLADGIVQRTRACQAVFSLANDVPTCAGPRDGTCLTADQKVAIGNIFAGARTSTGSRFYAAFPYDSGHAAFDVSFWEFISPLILDSSAVGFVFGTPPADPLTFIPPLAALTGNVDLLLASTFATNGVYTEASQSFMTPPDITKFGKQGRRMILYPQDANARVSPMESRLVYDVGLHFGEDSDFYLRKGFRVVAIDANPEMCRIAARRLARHVSSGQLVIVNKAISMEEGEVVFYDNPTNPEWGTIDPAWAARNRRLGAHISEIRVSALPLWRVVAEHGAPYFVKIDIEGLDLTALRSLAGGQALPKYVSIESEKVSFTKLREEFEVFQSLGYDRFKIVPQHRVAKQRPPNPPLEGAYTKHRFEPGASGLFGEEAPGRWLTAAEAIEAYKPIFLRYHLTGDDPLVRSWIMRQGLKCLGFRSGWYDTHARLAT